MKAKIVQINQSLGNYSAVTDAKETIVFSVLNNAELSLGDVILGDSPELGSCSFKLENSEQELSVKIMGIHSTQDPHHHS